MYGDFSRDSFQATNHFSRVLLQQGRVLLDADWNEQNAILLHLVRTLACDIMGPGVGPSEPDLYGFGITPAKATKGADGPTLLIGPGHYYVNGILCENEPRFEKDEHEEDDKDKDKDKDREEDARRELDYFDQADYPLHDPAGKDKLPTVAYLVYLDVWERSLTALEAPSIREVALGGPDTSARSRVTWQVKWTTKFREDGAGAVQMDAQRIYKQLAGWRRDRGLLKARATQPRDYTDPRTSSPDASYRGTANQLYRVEVHDQGQANTATFKWSRDNGSIMFPIRALAQTTVTLENLGQDSQRSLEENDWVEVRDDDDTLLGQVWPLAQVKTIQAQDRTIELTGLTTPKTYSPHDHRRPVLRRWDQRDGVPSRGGLALTRGLAKVTEATGEHGWLALEDGIQVQFFRPKGAVRADYQSGDYWLIPARAETADVEWPRTSGRPDARPPHGIQHHYAPLAVVDPETAEVHDLRRQLTPAWT